MSLADSITFRFNSASQNALQIGSKTPRLAQLLATITLPFFAVATMTAAVVLKEIIIELLPDVITPAIGLITFLLGSVLLIATMVLCFVWVRTGGFGLYA